MSSTNVYRVDFEIVKASAGGVGKAYAYRRGVRTALVAAVSSHPHDLLAVLNNDVTVNSGETIEILSANQVAVGSEGAGVLS